LKRLITIICLGLLLIGCSEQKTEKNPIAEEKPKNTINLDFIQIPEQIITTTVEEYQEMEQLNKKTREFMDQGKMDEAQKTMKEAQDIIYDDIFDGETLITEVFLEIQGLNAELIEPTDKAKEETKEKYLYSLELIDNKEKGLEGNAMTKYYRHINVFNDKHIRIPVLSDDGKQIFFAKAKITDELLLKIKKIVELSKQSQRALLNT